DARSSMTGSPAGYGASVPGTGYGATPAGNSVAGVGSIPEASGAAAATSPSAGSAASIVGDRYANTMPAAGGSGSSYSSGSSPYVPAGDYRSSASGYDTGSMAGQSAAGSSLGNTGYNPPSAYSTSGYSSSPSGAGATSAWPARSDSEYRPGGTSNYAAPTAQPVQPATSGAGSDPRAQVGGVTPASYQTPDVSGGRVTATMVSPVSGGSDYYGSYQGGGSSATTGSTSASMPGSLPKANW